MLKLTPLWCTLSLTHTLATHLRASGSCRGRIWFALLFQCEFVSQTTAGTNTHMNTLSTTPATCRFFFSYKHNILFLCDCYCWHYLTNLLNLPGVFFIDSLVRSIWHGKSEFPSSKSEMSKGTPPLSQISYPRLRHPRWLIQVSTDSESCSLCCLLALMCTCGSDYYSALNEEPVFAL